MSSVASTFLVIGVILALAGLASAIVAGRFVILYGWDLLWANPDQRHLVREARRDTVRSKRLVKRRVTILAAELATARAADEQAALRRVESSRRLRETTVMRALEQANDAARAREDNDLDVQLAAARARVGLPPVGDTPQEVVVTEWTRPVIYPDSDGR